MSGPYSWNFVPESVDPQMGRSPVGFWKGAATGFEQGIESTIPGLAYRHLKTTVGAKISEDEFNASIYPSAGITWSNNMTWAAAQAAYDARIDKQNYDDVANRMTGAGKFGEFVGGFAGAALDPVNLLPMGTANVSRSFLSNVMRVGAVNAALEAGLYQPYEHLVHKAEQMPTNTPSQYAMNVALAAGIGGMFGALGHGIEKWAENSALKLGKLGESVADSRDLTPVTAAPTDAPRTPLQPDTAPVQRSADAPASATAPQAPAASPRADANTALAPNAKGAGARPDIEIRFPDAAHERLFKLDITKPEDLAWLEGNGFTLEDYKTYRSATMRRVEDQRKTVASNVNAERSVPAPLFSGINENPNVFHNFTDPDLAQMVQRRFDLTASDKSKTSPAREAILQDELVTRANQLASHTSKDAPVPEKMPSEGVLMQRTSSGREGTVAEYPLDEWYRRIFHPNFSEEITRKNTHKILKTGETQVAFERRPNWQDPLVAKLQRLTPEQLDYTLHRMMNPSDVEALAKHLNIEGGDNATRARAIQEAIQPRGGEPLTPSRVADRAVAAEEAGRIAEMHKRVEAEGKAVQDSATVAHDELTGVASVNNAAEAESFIKQRFDIAKLRAATPEAEKAAQAIERISKKQEAIMRTMACILGAK